MSTSHRFDRVVDWVLDVDGEIYGDERARLRWYEGLAFTASVQWVLVLWVLAVCAWLAPTAAAPYLWVIGVAFVLPMYLSIAYATRRRVDITPPPRTRKVTIIQAVTFLPMVIFVAGMTVGVDLRNGQSWSAMSPALLGAAVGGLIGAGALVILKQRQRKLLNTRLSNESDSGFD